jgi:hypothetical protein
MSSTGKSSSSPSSSSSSSSISSPTSLLSPAVLVETNLSPLTFLARTEGRGYTSVEAEIWDTVHRLYVYLATCQRAPHAERLAYFRCLVRLCIRHRPLLLRGVASLATDGDAASFEACVICRRGEYAESEPQSARTTRYCCWFRPDSHAQGFLQQVLALCDNNLDLFGDEVSLEEFQGLFVFA